MHRRRGRVASWCRGCARGRLPMGSRGWEFGDRASIFCPHCGRHTSIEPALRTARALGGTQKIPACWAKGSDLWWIAVCNACQEPVLVLNSGVRVFPHPRPSPTHEAIPGSIASDLSEAKLCYSVGAWNAAATMARRAIQRASVDRGAPGDRKLHAQIDHLADQGTITSEMKSWAHAIRDVGNDGAHPPESVTDAEAADSDDRGTLTGPR